MSAVLIGQTYGTLTVVAGAGWCVSRKNRLWLCRCACGGSAKVVASNLRSGTTKTCGAGCPLRVLRRGPRGHYKKRTTNVSIVDLAH
jgi:hypothetical protein